MMRKMSMVIIVVLAIFAIHTATTVQAQPIKSDKLSNKDIASSLKTNDFIIKNELMPSSDSSKDVNMDSIKIIGVHQSENKAYVFFQYERKPSLEAGPGPRKGTSRLFRLNSGEWMWEGTQSILTK
jgi:hypothetical protein